MRKKLLVANWKLNHTKKSAEEFFLAIKPHFQAGCEVAVAPVLPMLEWVRQSIQEMPIKLAAQNVFYASSGAFTGECSAEQLFEVGVTYCLVGHSERRTLFFETDSDVEKKAKACFRAGITPIVCVGESLLERENNQTKSIIERQLSAVVESLRADQEMVIAYEPIWAIGTNKTALASQIQEVHQMIREFLAKSLGKQVTTTWRILYGGSVNAGNIGEIATLPDVDGVLVGGASLQAASFLSMVEKLHHAE